MYHLYTTIFPSVSVQVALKSQMKIALCDWSLGIEWVLGNHDKGQDFNSF